MTKINFTLEELKLIVLQMEQIEYSGVSESSSLYKRALEIKNIAIKIINNNN
jgi:hypothetical protein|tara:strand:+ start:1671 stop:1826 length:156 start_codon:yes stop_codon:yes gene_type:complete